MAQTDILMFLPNLESGGAERVLLNLAAGFSARGYRVHLVVANAKGPLVKSVPANLETIDLKSSRTLSSIPALSGYLRRVRPKVLLSVQEHANVVALAAKRLSGLDTKVAICVHSCTSATASTRPGLKHKILPLLFRWTYGWADELIAVSSGVAEDLVQVTHLPRERVKVLFNPVVDQALLERSLEPITHRWFLKGEPPVVLSVGRLEVRKDFETLIRAFSLVRAHRRARLVILGEGPDRESLTELIRALKLDEDVDMPGFAANPYPFMRQAAVFVMSSLTEALPTVLIEALACGTPVVSTDCPHGPREILEDGKFGTLVPMGSPALLAKAIEETLDGKAVVPSPESSARFRSDLAVDNYLRTLFPDGNEVRDAEPQMNTDARGG